MGKYLAIENLTICRRKRRKSESGKCY